MSSLNTAVSLHNFRNLLGIPSSPTPMSIMFDDLLTRPAKSANDGKITKMPSPLSERDIQRIDDSIARIKAPLGEASTFYDGLMGKEGSFMSHYGQDSKIEEVALKLLVLRETCRVLGDTEGRFIKATINAESWWIDKPVQNALDILNGTGYPSRVQGIYEVVQDLSKNAPKLADMIICCALREGISGSEERSRDYKCGLASLRQSPEVFDTIYLHSRERSDGETRTGLYKLLPKKGQDGHTALCTTIISDLRSKNSLIVAEAALTLAYLGCEPEGIKKVNAALRMQRMKVKNLLHPDKAREDGDLQTLKFAALCLENRKGAPFEGSFDALVEGLSTTLTPWNALMRRGGGF